MDTYFENAKGVQRAIEFTQRFERLHLPCLNILEKWRFCVTLFVKDIDFVQKEYNEQRESPPVARNMPPVAGRIGWCRQLYRRLKAPVNVFRGQPELMALADTRKAIKMYNRLAKTLVEYEVVFLQVWRRQVDEARALLNCTVLVRNPDSSQLLVNIDKRVSEMVREVAVLRMMGFEIPTSAQNFAAMGESLKTKIDEISVSCSLISVHMYQVSLLCVIQLMVAENDRIRGKIPELFSALMEPHLEKVDEVISPGLTVLRWSSLNIDSYLQAVGDNLKELELLVDRVSHTHKIRIEGVLQDIQNTQLCELPDSEPWTIDEFVNCTQVDRSTLISL